jgi:hypothetical protein
MNWEAFVTQVLKTAGLAVVGTLAAKLASETESQLAKTEPDIPKTDTTEVIYIKNYLKQELKNLGIG